MPIYLDTRGNTVLSVAVCDRCRRKFAYTELYPDPNFPGMRVCKEDLDNFDPWRLPARQTENIALRFPRPDTNIALQPNQILTETGFTNGNSLFITGVPPTNRGQGDLNTDSFPYAIGTLVPAIYEIDPNNGPQAGGTTVTIHGLNFTDVTSVKFGGIDATYAIDNVTTLTATTPAAPVTGLVDVKITTAFGTAINYGGFTYE
jgi:hypothetical protein